MFIIMMMMITSVLENSNHHLCLDHLCFFLTEGFGNCLFTTWRLVVSTEVRDPKDCLDSDFIHGNMGSGKSLFTTDSYESYCLGLGLISCKLTDELAWLVWWIYPLFDKNVGFIYKKEEEERKKKREKYLKITYNSTSSVFLSLPLALSHKRTHTHTLSLITIFAQIVWLSNFFLFFHPGTTVLNIVTVGENRKRGGYDYHD